MEYTWTNSSWQRMEVMRKQEDYQSKLTRDMHNFYHGGGNRVNTYGGSNHGHGNFVSRGNDGYGNFTPKRHKGVDNFSSYAKSYECTSYDDYGSYERFNSKYVEHSPYNCYKGSNDYYDYGNHSSGRGKIYEDLSLINPILRSKTHFQFDRKNLEEIKASKPQLHKLQDLGLTESKNKNSKTQSKKEIG
ncbi:hypothetical protein M9H77_22697 [Catharanthus roseus]|uniref:Uncharacterized protein n=1 Tax=Catharanthus roseus TaxID=4058 RepID=A0ACC0ATC7_CATRO|nr:hypothetical protein M9H77_22697 [Catharanthus roseus]